MTVLHHSYFFKMFQYSLILLFIANLISADYLLGPYEVLLKQLRQCSDEGTRELRMENGKIRKNSKTKFALSANLIVESDIDMKTFFLDLDIAALGGNGVWREHYYYQKCGLFCESFKRMLPKFFVSFMKTIGLDCAKTITKGNYSFNDMDLTLDFHLPFIPYNKYKVDVIFLRKGKKIGCLQFLTDVIPKRNSKN